MRYTAIASRGDGDQLLYVSREPSKKSTVPLGRSPPLCCRAQPFTPSLAEKVEPNRFKKQSSNRMFCKTASEVEVPKPIAFGQRTSDSDT